MTNVNYTIPKPIQLMKLTKMINLPKCNILCLKNIITMQRTVQLSLTILWIMLPYAYL